MTIQFTCVDSTTGQIHFQGSADDPSVLATPGVSVIGSLAPSNTYWNGSAWTAIPPNPNPVYTWDWPSHTWLDARTLAQVQAAQIAMLNAAYQNAIVQPVSYTSKGGVTKTFQADPQSQQNLAYELATYTAAAATPTGYYWVAADNTQVPFTFADLQGLAAAMGAPGFPAFAHLQTQKAAVAAAATIAAVQAVVW